MIILTLDINNKYRMTIYKSNKKDKNNDQMEQVKELWATINYKSYIQNCNQTSANMHIKHLVLGKVIK